MPDTDGNARSTGLLVESKIVPIDSVKKNTWNPNVMPDSVFTFLKKSIKSRGFVVPIVVTKDMTIIDGEHRWLAMKDIGQTEIEVKVLDLTDEEAKADTVNFNLTKGEFDQQKLAILLNEITKNKVAEDVENMLVMRQKEIARIVAKHCGESPACTEQESEFREVTTTIQRGDIIALGNHRVMCGDSSNPDDIESLFGDDQKARLCVTSPPYYNQREYSQWDTYQDFLKFCDDVIAGIRSVLNPESSAVAWNMGSSESEHEFIPADNYFQFRNHGFTWIEWIVWKKQCAQWNIPRSQNIDTGLYVPALRWESICIYMLGSRPRFDMNDVRKVREWQENLWEMQKVLGNEQRAVGHPAMFPMELPYRCILSLSQPGDLVYEPFSGSGQTLLAGEQTGRRCYAMELSPEYCELTAQRWEQMTGQFRRVLQ